MNQNTLARILTAVAAGFVAIFLVAVIMATRTQLAQQNPELTPAQSEAVQRQRSLLEQRILLDARIRLCEKQEKGDVPAYRTVCTPEEIAALPDLRKKLADLDREMSGGSAPAAPAP